MARNNKKIRLALKNEGFTLIGVLTASIIGLIVIAGLTQMMVHLSSSISKLEKQSKMILFIDEIWTELKDGGCKNTLDQCQDSSDPANCTTVSQIVKTGGVSPNKDVSFKRIYNKVNFPTINLNDREMLSRKHGLDTDSDSDLRFILTCVSEDPPGTKNCDCSSMTTDCRKEWELQLVSQIKVSGTLIYNRLAYFGITTEFTDSDPNEVTCPVLSAQGGGTPIDLNDILPDIEQHMKKYFEDNFFHVTSIGKNAGNQINKENVFIGNQAGQSTTGEKNTFVGYDAGQANTSGEYNTFLGYEAGKASENGYFNIFVGSEAGKANTRGGQNIFVGYRAGHANTTGNYNTFIGMLAGRDNTTEDYNTFVGYRAGQVNTSGRNNTFMGSEAGRSNTTGVGNIFVGYHTGLANTTGVGNVLIGNQSGDANTSGGYNVNIGNLSGSKNNTGKENTFIGNLSGYENTTGDNNIFIGHRAGFSNTTGNNILAIGENWIAGTIGGSSLTVGGAETVNASSKTLKKNIKPFKKFKQALDDILNTPLFTYQYKEKDRHPKKKRMGIISEELPDHLQLKSKDYPPQPDWPSIYGAFWAGIKALHKMFSDFKNETSSQINSLTEKFNSQINNLTENINSQFKQLKLEAFNQINIKFKQLKDELLNKLLAVQKESSELKTKLNKYSKESVQTKTKILDTNKLCLEIYKLLENTTKELEDTKRKLDQTESDLKTTNKKLAHEITEIKQDITKNGDQQIKALSQEVKELKLKLEETQKELKDLKKKDLQ